MEKRGQITIFIIIGIMIVALGILIFLFFPQIKTGLGISTNNPQLFIQNCMEEKVESVVEILSLNGGSANPENYFLFGVLYSMCYATAVAKTTH
jgi:hypothetical protein